MRQRADTSVKVAGSSKGCVAGIDAVKFGLAAPLQTDAVH